MRKSRKKSKSREPIIARTVFFTGMLIEILKYFGWQNQINSNLMVVYPVLMIIFSLFFAMTHMDSWVESITNFLVGVALYFSLTYAIVLFGTIGLNSSSLGVIEGLSRISVALFAIWKLHSDMRHIDLTLKPGQKSPHKLIRPMYGLLFPRKEFGRLIKIVFYVGLTFVLITSGIDLITSSNVDPKFLEQTEKISTNLLFVGLQSPLLMASRTSVSRTFSNYLDNYSELVTRYQNNLDLLNSAIKKHLNVKTLSYSEINSNGKHLWIGVILIFFLETFKVPLIAFYNQLNLVELFYQLLGLFPSP